MYHGIVTTLADVHHVPELKKNLVSVGVMDSKGFSSWVDGGVMQIRGKEKYVVM